METGGSVNGRRRSGADLRGEWRKRKEQRRRKAVVFCLLLCGVALCVIIYSIIELRRVNDIYTRLRNVAVSETVIRRPAKEQETAEAPEAPPGDAENSVAWDGTGAELSVDFTILLSQNDDTVGWLHVPAAEISYPVLHYAGDNDYYLYRTFTGDESASGSIYLECTNAPDFTDRSSFIYGHNTIDGSMFGRLQKRFLKEGAADEDPFFYLYLPDGTVRRYLVFSCYRTTKESDTYRTFSSDEAYDWYAEYTSLLSEIRTDATALLAARQPIVTLSTCAGRSGSANRFVVHGIFAGELAPVR